VQEQHPLPMLGWRVVQAVNVQEGYDKNNEHA
jgi:hypothetical protein